MVMATMAWSVSARELNEVVTCNVTAPAANECGTYGSCIGGRCVCDMGHVTAMNVISIPCEYEQKSQITAFLLEFFLGWFCSAGLWYLGNALWAGLKIASLLGICLPVCCAGVKLCNSDGEKKQDWTMIVSWCFTIIFVFIWICLHISTLVLIALNNGRIVDSNGVSMRSW